MAFRPINKAFIKQKYKYLNSNSTYKKLNDIVEAFFKKDFNSISKNITIEYDPEKKLVTLHTSHKVIANEVSSRLGDLKRELNNKELQIKGIRVV